MRYGLYDHPPMGTTLIAALQWLFVTLSSSLVVPLVIGDIFGLDSAETGRFMQQMIFFVGVASLLQVWLGHRYPMMEAPAGLWWGIFVILAQIGSSIGHDPRVIGQSLQLGLMLAGVLFLLLGSLGLISRIQRWFTPVITGTYMILLAVSLSSTFVKRLLGIGFQGAEGVQPQVAVASVVIMGVVFGVLRIRAFSSFAVLSGMVIGWLGFAALGWAEPINTAGQSIVFPQLFFWGPLHWDSGVILTCVLTGFVMLANLIASIVVISKATQAEATEAQFNRGGIFTGVSHFLAGLSGVVGMIPLSMAAAVIETTKMASRRPFIIAMWAMVAIGFLPAVSRFFAAIPTPVAYAAMFASYTQLLGFGLRDYSRVPMNERNIRIIGSSLLIGIGVMFVPADAWRSLHPLLSFLLGNGLLLGVLVSLFLEHVVFRQGRPGQEKPSSSR